MHISYLDGLERDITAVVKKKDRERVPLYMIEPREMTEEEKEKQNRWHEAHLYYGLPMWDGPEDGQIGEDYNRASWLLFMDTEIPDDLGNRLLQYKRNDRTEKIKNIIEYISRNAPDAAFIGSSAVRFCYGGSRNPDGIDIVCLNKLKQTLDAYFSTKAKVASLEDYIETASCEKFIVDTRHGVIDINVSVVKTGTHKVKTVNNLRTLGIHEILEERLLSSGTDSLGALHDACYILNAFSNELNNTDIESASAILSLLKADDIKKYADGENPDTDGVGEVLRLFNSACKKLGINRKVGLKGESRSNRN